MVALFIVKTDPKNIDEQRWNALGATLDCPFQASEFKRLESAYSEPHRAYHTLQHLSECMEKLDWAIAQGCTGNFALAEIALWYHDAVYQPRATDNELKSADWAGDYLRSTGLSTNDCETVHSLIMATCHGAQPEDTTHRLVVDIDLAILGAETPRFAEYEQQVRKEYRWVPWLLYRKKRRELLENFLHAPYLYGTELFRQRYEQPARENLADSIASLR